MKLKQIIYIVIGLLLLAGLFFVFKPKPSSENSNSSNQAQPETSTTPTPSKAKVFELVIQGRKVASGPQALSVIQGDEVTIKITSDEDEELHLHAYDNSVELKAGIQAELKLTASISGRFPYELEKSGTEIGVLEVQPK